MRYRALLIDLSGTLHIDGKAIPRAIEALERLRRAKVPCRFVTNTTKDSIGSLLNTLTDLGFDIQKEEASMQRNLLGVVVKDETTTELGIKYRTCPNWLPGIFITNGHSKAPQGTKLKTSPFGSPPSLARFSRDHPGGPKRGCGWACS